MTESTSERDKILVWADGYANSEAYWSERNSKWVFVDFLNHGEETSLVQSWVEVGLDESEVDPALIPQGSSAADCGLNQATIACDLDGDGSWVIDSEDFAALQETYGDALYVKCVGTDNGEILVDEAAASYLAE